MRCPSCGSDESGKFCSQCGTPLKAGGGRHCTGCGAALEGSPMYCPECGTPTGHRPRKGAASYLPWILSAGALVAFAVAISLFVQGQASERAPGMPPTGGIITGEEQAGGGAGAGGAGMGAAGGAAGGAMPSAGEIASMPPREAADRLFDRAMATQEQADSSQAAFFANMAVQAYGQVPPAEMDLDARFHIGLLEILQGNPGAATQEAETILAADPDHLLGLSLAARAAAAAGDAEGERRWYARFLEALPTGMAEALPEYEAHRTLVAREADRAREVVEGE